jgi:galactose mutarotase-like enzyme
MLYSIENEFIKVAVSDKGAELQSIVKKSNGIEYLWQGNPAFWSGRAYNLFPICGRLTEGKYTYKNKTYEMDIHGFVKKSVLQAEKISDSEIKFTIAANEKTKKQYPFDFVFSVTYSIKGCELLTKCDIKNTGKETMYFGLGGHPGFNVPLLKDEAFEDYYLEFDCVKPIKKIVMTPLFYTGKTEPYALKEGKILELSHSLFDNDAIFFTDMCSFVTLKSKKSDCFVRMEYKGMQNLGIWHAPKKEAPYVCIEPWTSVPSYDGKIDDLESKPQMTVLKADTSYENEFKIIIG